MNFCFITGMSRSGTTLLDKCLNSFPAAQAFSQPFPYLYRKIKEFYFKTINYPKTYYVLNNYFDESRYTIDQFTDFLTHWFVPPNLLTDALNEMQGWSGQTTKISINDVFLGVDSLCFSDKLKNLLQNLADPIHSVVACKEIHCEEFLPTLVRQGWKAILVIRNPLDVLCSIQYGKGEEYVGKRRPTLFHVRNWRKSAQFAMLLKGDPNFRFVKFEDIIASPEKALKNISDFLGIQMPEKIQLKDQSGEKWISNSSFNDGANQCNSIFDQQAPGRFSKILPPNLIEYISYLCAPEMKFFGYSPVHSEGFDPAKFIEPFEITCGDFDRNFSSTNLIDYEFLRLKSIKTGHLPLEPIFLDPKVFKMFVEENLESAISSQK